MSRTEQERKRLQQMMERENLSLTFAEWLRSHGKQPSAKYEAWLMELMDRVLSEGETNGTK